MDCQRVLAEWLVLRTWFKERFDVLLHTVVAVPEAQESCRFVPVNEMIQHLDPLGVVGLAVNRKVERDRAIVQGLERKRSRNHEGRLLQLCVHDRVTQVKEIVAYPAAGIRSCHDEHSLSSA